MVMSAPTRLARASCIRCGGVEFHVLEQGGNRCQREPVVFASSSQMLPRFSAARDEVAFAPITSVASALDGFCHGGSPPVAAPI
jgi:hypothetical protein